MLQRALLLPGLHGTTELFGPLLERARGELELELEALAYPTTGPQDYPSLARALSAHLPGPGAAPYALVAESFGAPLALRLAAGEPPGLSALVLVNGFASAPLPPVARLLSPLVGRVLRPNPVVLDRLLGRDAPATLRAQVAQVLRELPPALLRERLRVVLSANAVGAYVRTQLPIFYLRGEDDRLVPEAALQTLIRIRPGLQVMRTPGPHLLLQRHPERSLELLRRCLTERDA